MLTMGIDAGSRAIKIVVLDGAGDRVVCSAIADQGVKQDVLAQTLADRLLAEHGLDRADVIRTVATGYARHGVAFADTTITEITCHARGVRSLVPEARTVIEIGGQDSKVLRLDATGGVRDFGMNDRCAAGTGRFLEVVAQRLEVALDDLSELAERSTDPAAISSMCVVFAETEIIGLLAGGTSPDDIVAGVQNSIASRITALAGRRPDPPIVFTGGVALLPGMVAALESVLDQPVIVCPTPQLTGALGAALLARA